MDYEEQIEAIARAIDPERARRARKGWQVRCRFHDDGNPSMVLYSDGWYHCFSCRSHGKIKDLANGPVKLRFKKRDVDAHNEPQSIKLDLPLPWVDEMHKTLMRDPGAIKRLADMGFSIEALKLLKVGKCDNKGRYALPIINADAQVVGLRIYWPTAQKQYQQAKIIHFRPPTLDKAITICQQTWFGEHLIKMWKPGSQVWLCEGESDCLAATSVGLQALSTVGGCMFVPSEASLMRLAGFLVVVAYDADKAGREGARRIIAALQKLGIKVSAWAIPDGKKDMREWVMSCCHLVIDKEGKMTSEQ